MIEWKVKAGAKERKNTKPKLYCDECRRYFYKSRDFEKHQFTEHQETERITRPEKNNQDSNFVR